MNEFVHAFDDADTLFVLDIYAAGETPIEGITGETLAQRIHDAGKQETRYAASFAEAVTAVVSAAREGDLILTLGAGSVSQLGPMILEEFRLKHGRFAESR